MISTLLALAVTSATTFVDVHGQPVTPTAFAKARATVWVFVGTDCPISNAYAPEINRLVAAYKGKATFYLIYSDPATKRKEAEAHFRSYHLAGTGVCDPRQVLMNQALASKTPEAAVFSASGNMVYRGRIDDRWAQIGVKRGSATTHELKDAIVATLAGKSPKVSRTIAVGCYIPTP